MSFALTLPMAEFFNQRAVGATPMRQFSNLFHAKGRK
jgi:hypothetical protein